MSQSETLVSVVMPLFNAEAYVEDAVRSVLAQTHERFELLVVDDGSTDGSAAIVDAIPDPRLRLLRKPNGGVSSARNRALREAGGTIIALIDSDDLWEPRKLERHLAHFAARPQVGVSYCPSAMMDAEGAPVGLTQSPKLTDLTPLDVYCGRAVQNGSVPVIRRAMFDAIAFEGPAGSCYFDESLERNEDIECWTRMALTSPLLFEGIAEPLTWYRLNPGGLSADIEGQWTGWLAAHEKIRGYAPDFIATHGPAARAYQLRNLARRSVRVRDGRAAWNYMRQTLETWPAILREEPGKSVTTLAAAGLLRLLPAPIFSAAEHLAVRLKSRG